MLNVLLSSDLAKGGPRASNGSSRSATRHRGGSVEATVPVHVSEELVISKFFILEQTERVALRSKAVLVSIDGDGGEADNSEVTQARKGESRLFSEAVDESNTAVVMTANAV